MSDRTQASQAAALLGKIGGRSRSPAKAAAARANGAKGGRPVRPAGVPHRWTFAEVEAVLGARCICVTAGRGLVVRAYCNAVGGEDGNLAEPAHFDVLPSWGDRIGPRDDCERPIDAIERRIAARFPAPRGWWYDPASGIVVQS